MICPNLPVGSWKLSDTAPVPGPDDAARAEPGSTPNCVALKLLNVSTRICKPTLSVKLNVLAKAMSQLLIPGPRKMLRPALPNVPARGCVKHAVLNHSVGLF